MAHSKLLSANIVVDGFPYVSLSQTKEPAKAGTCARDRRALQQLDLNVHVKHSDSDPDPW